MGRRAGGGRHRHRGGGSWTGLPAPPAPVGVPGQAGVVWGIRFATPGHGFVFGDGLWETTDGGQRWSRVTAPFGSVLSLAIVPGQVLALVARCTPGGGCDRYGILAGSSASPDDEGAFQSATVMPRWRAR